ncbi:MAG: flavin reductase family protein [Candidatus Solibacter sp.]|nr:flavin reductase family protein [Candidatus Solibacter sp.]
MSSERYAGQRAPVGSEEFRRACGRFATGVSVASVLDAKGAPHGLTVSSLTSVSLDPPLILICLGHAVSAIHHFRAATHFGINILAEDQRALSERFARKGQDRFDGVAWQPGVTGVPLLPGVLAAIECAVHRIVPMGDHDILVGEMVHAQVNDGQPLLYFAGSYREL